MRKSHTAGWASDAPTPAQLKELFSQIASGRINKRRLQTFLRSGTVFKNEEVARMILGDDIVFPDETAEARGLSYTDAQLKHFADTMPSEEVLRWFKTNGYAIVAGPPSPMGLLEVRSLKSEHFYSKAGGWYEGHAFGNDDKAQTEWLAIRKEPVPNSFNQNWNEQLRLLSKDEQVPNAGEMSWFITTFYEVRGVRLFEKVYVRTSSVPSGGYRVFVGDFDEGGLCVDYYWDDVRYYSLGLAASRKIPEA
jgi:hypothetical protein